MVTMHDADEVSVYCRYVVFRGQFAEQFFFAVAPCVVHPDVDRAETFRAFVPQRLYLFMVPYIARLACDALSREVGRQQRHGRINRLLPAA
ncbi:MAG: hypothetical protein P8Y61_14930 [Gammaproteobacteria bacterium]